MAGNSIHDQHDRPVLFDMVGADLDHTDLLDIGGSIGELSVQFLKRGANVTLVDIDAEACAIASRVLGGYVQVHELDLRTRPWPFADASFDIVVASLVLDLIDDLTFLTEVTRVMRQDGRFIVSVPHPDAVGGSDQPRKGIFDRYGQTFELDWFVRPITSLQDAFTAAGLKVTRMVEPVPPVPAEGADTNPWIVLFELMHQDPR